ncbi:MAG TPA: hypothetical protein VK574_17125 [Terracidiphilus sp.]|nr:hypothetical protein [Terracidiphilus sp.]
MPVRASIRAVLAIAVWTSVMIAAPLTLHAQQPPFPISSHCFGCHNNLKTARGQDVSIGSPWRASIMANSARDPYWQASVRREALDHASTAASIENECATCHMPLQHFVDKAAGHDTAVLSRMPLDAAHEADASAADGVACAVCHQAEPAGLGTADSYNGNLTTAPTTQHPRPLYGPYAAEARSISIHNLASGLTVMQSDHLGQTALCGSCHTLFTPTLDASGKAAGRFPEQMPYIEWLHSDYHDKQTCQSCHMPAIAGPAPDATLGSAPREGLRRHSFPGANFFMQDLLVAHHDDLAVTASPAELTAASTETRAYLQSQAAHLSVSALAVANGHLSFAVTVQNLTGHKFPTAYPSRRAWLHVTITDASGHVVFESGHLNDDGSIAGNLNDADATRYSPHYATITAPDQVQIFEPILGDAQDHVTTALLTATHYLKDNRILPAGFDKQTASPDIAVHGEAASDPAFIGGSATTRYEIPTGAAAGTFVVKAELLYQPVGFRWAHNLAPYKAAEPQRFVTYYEQAAKQSAIVIAEASGSI